MSTLAEVQAEVSRQLWRDYRNKTYTYLRSLAALGLAEEAGEVAGLMKRIIRQRPQDLQRATSEHFKEELGDVLWYLAVCCEAQGTTLEDIWQYNIKKLKERYPE